MAGRGQFLRHWYCSYLRGLGRTVLLSSLLVMVRAKARGSWGGVGWWLAVLLLTVLLSVRAVGHSRLHGGNFSVAFVKGRKRGWVLGGGHLVNRTTSVISWVSRTLNLIVVDLMLLVMQLLRHLLLLDEAGFAYIGWFIDWCWGWSVVLQLLYCSDFVVCVWCCRLGNYVVCAFLLVMERLATVQHGMTRSSFQVSIPWRFNGALLVQIYKAIEKIVWVSISMRFIISHS